MTSAHTSSSAQALGWTRHLAEGKGVGLLAPTSSVSLEDIPEQCRFDKSGEPARMVIVMPPHLCPEFDRRSATLAFERRGEAATLAQLKKAPAQAEAQKVSAIIDERRRSAAWGWPVE
jgi:hypothetical protein